MSEDNNRPRGNKPVEVLRDGALKLSIFRNVNEHGETYAMVPGRIYTDKDSGQVREADSINSREALRMAHLLTKGHDKVAELRERNLAQSKPNGQRKARGGYDHERDVEHDR